MINDFLSKYITKDEKIILAISCGPDSMFLLDKIINSDYKNNIVAVYFNHKLRQQSCDEQKFFIEFCNKNNIEYEVWKADIMALQKETISISIEELARAKRYEFLRKIKNKYNANYILTAHHLDDKIETFFFNALRGSKLTWLINMLDKSWDILRPLLNITKPEILDYLNKNNIKYFIDESNFDSSYTRNFLRLDILPKLDKINKNYKQNLANLMNYLEENKDFIDREVVKFLWIEESDKTYFSVAEFNDISKFLQKEVIRYCFYIANNSSTIWLTEKNIAEIIKFINSKWNKTVKNIKNLKMFKDWDKLYYK